MQIDTAVVIPGFDKYRIYPRRQPDGADIINAVTGRKVKLLVNNGYNTVTLTCVDNETHTRHAKKMLLSRLRLLTFIGNPPDKSYTADHINRDRSNDDIDNLRWSTRSQQSLNRKNIKRVGTCLSVKRVHLETGAVETFMSQSHVPNVKCSTVGYRTKKQSIVDGWKWSYNVLDVKQGEEFRKIGDKIWASNEGRVAIKRDDDYIGVSLSEGHRYQRVVRNGKTMQIHRAVFEAFHERKLEPHEVIDHIDENPKNFALRNLRAVTNAENLQYANMYMYEVTNKLTGDMFVSAGLADVAERCGISVRCAGKYACDDRNSSVWRITRTGRFLDS